MLSVLRSANHDTIGLLEAMFPRRKEWSYDVASESARAQTRIAKLERFGLLDNCATALDVGGGTGGFSACLSQRGIRVAAVDRNPHVIKQGLKELGSDLPDIIQADAASMPFDSGTFDLATSWDAYEHLADPRAVTDEVHRCLKPDGRYYIQCGGLFPSPWGGHLYRLIRIPWVHLLFDDATCAEHLAHNGYAHHRNNPYSDHPSKVWVNRLPLSYFRELQEEGKWEVAHWCEAPVSEHEQRFGQSIRDLMADWSDEDLFTATFDAVLRKC